MAPPRELAGECFEAAPDVDLFGGDLGDLLAPPPAGKREGQRQRERGEREAKIPAAAHRSLCFRFCQAKPF